MSRPSGSRPSSASLPPVIQLRPYQQAWIDDKSRFKGAVKSARIGFTFASMVEAVLDCLERVTTLTVLSASKEQGKEAVGDAGRIIEAMGAVAQLYEEPFADELGESSIQQTRLQLPNGSRIIVLPANPRTARGYPGNAILDEFGHHDKSYSIWAAISRQVLLQGHKLRILSTPNAEQGKFFELAREFGLIDGVAPAPNPIRRKNWSWHWVDLHMAIAQGCPISLEDAMDLYKGDPETAQQATRIAYSYGFNDEALISAKRWANSRSTR